MYTHTISSRSHRYTLDTRDLIFSIFGSNFSLAVMGTVYTKFQLSRGQRKVSYHAVMGTTYANLLYTVAITVRD